MSYQLAFDGLYRRLKEQRQTVVDRIVRGDLTPTEYARLCGSIQGLEFAEQSIKDLAQRLEQDDE